MVFSKLNDECMIFVEELGVVGKVVGEELGEIVVGGFFVAESVPREEAAGIGIDYKDGASSGVEQDAVGGFGTNAFP